MNNQLTETTTESKEIVQADETVETTLNTVQLAGTLSEGEGEQNAATTIEVQPVAEKPVEDTQSLVPAVAAVVVALVALLVALKKVLRK